MKLLKYLSFFLFCLLLLISYYLLFPPKAEAACWCKNPAAAGCACLSNGSNFQEPFGPADAAAGFKDGQYFDAEYGGIALTCNTAQEAASLTAKKSPICGAAVGPEVAPYCAPNKNDPSEITCYGTGFYEGALSIPADTGGARISWNKEAEFNGFKGFASHLVTCSANNFCCARSDGPDNSVPCDDGGVPKFYNETNICTPTSTERTGPPAICGEAFQSQTDSRIYFPHARNISAITYLLQSFFRPFSLGWEAIKKQVVYSKVDLHQGINDDTPVFNTTDNNMSLVPGFEAPNQPFDFTAPPPGVPEVGGSCVISNVRTNPGDDLLGKKIYADFQYTQEFRYDLTPGLLDGSKKPTGTGVRTASECASGDAFCVPTGPGRPPSCTCNPKKVFLPTKGKVLVYTKSPFLEYLYENLVGGPMAIYRHFLSKDLTRDIEDLSTRTNIGVIAFHFKRGESEVLAGDAQRAPEIYFPRLGSVYEYFLLNLQRLLRPRSTAVSAVAVGTPTPSPTDCSPLDYTIGFRDTSVSPKPTEELIAALREANPGGFSQSIMNKAAENIRKNYTTVVAESQAAGYNPAFVMATWIEETAASALSGLDFGCGGAASNDFDGQLACFLSLHDDWSKNGRYDNLVGTCREGGDNPNFEDFMLYFAEGICQTVERQARQFCGIHKNFPARFKSFYDVVVD